MQHIQHGGSIIAGNKTQSLGLDQPGCGQFWRNYDWQAGRNRFKRRQPSPLRRDRMQQNMRLAHKLSHLLSTDMPHKAHSLLQPQLSYSPTQQLRINRLLIPGKH